MAARKLYAGVQLRGLRQSQGLTQKDFAARLGVSLSYLNQMENNHRPVPAGVVLALAREFAFDVGTLNVDEAERMAVDMREALADPVFGDLDVPAADLSLTASNAPALARAFLALHRQHRESQERLATLDQQLSTDRGQTGLSPLPWEEVRDFFHYCDNYIDPLDRAAERFADQTGGSPAAIARWLEERHDVGIDRRAGGPLRRFDPLTGTLSINARADAPTQTFQIAHQVALLEYPDLLDATLDLARFRTDEARAIARIGLANYFAGAAMMPYGRFLTAAKETRHDLEQLAYRFNASIEQVAHRLSTLQRSGAKGVPFFFVRVDQAGTITKRHSATRLQFARFGGACPLWNVHRAFETPGRFLRQLAETPDGVRYLCLARDVSKPGGSWNAPERRFAIGLGCEVSHADALVYSDGLDLANGPFEPIGISCRICERTSCHQRSVPPLERRITVDPDERDVIPYRLG
ncbi:MAG: helix-turn-helix domain-containing protein [Rubricella sp.]